MKYRIFLIYIIAWTQILIDGSILALVIVAFVSSRLDHDVMLTLFKGFDIWSQGELDQNVYINSLFSLPTFVGAAGVVKFKEWGRRTLVLGSFISAAYILFYPLYYGSTATSPTVLEPTIYIPVLWYFWICFYFNWPSVQKRFS